MEEYYSFARTSIGFSHVTSQKPCQDYSESFQYSGASVIIVSDGHGSSNFTRSDRGSKFACEAAKDATKEFIQSLDVKDLENEFLRDDIVFQFCKNIILRWNVLVNKDANSDPFTEEEVTKVADKYKQRYLNGTAVEHAYGCTLILAIVTQNFCLAIRNGDGQYVAVDRDGCFMTPIPWNDNCEFNVTTSLCDENAIENFRYFFSTELPAAAFAGSDGVDDSYTSVEELYNLYRNICVKALNDGVDAVAEYVETLLPIITKRGSTDDVSVAGLLNLTALEDARTAIEIALERYQMNLAESRREQKKRVILRDIKVAEKKKAKAETQLQETQKKREGIKVTHTRFLEQISFFRKKADACRESMASLSHDEEQIANLINEANCEIIRLNNELRALEGQTEVLSVQGSGTAISSAPTDGFSLKEGELLACEENFSDKQKTDAASVAQELTDEIVSQDPAHKTVTEDVAAPE